MSTVLEGDVVVRRVSNGAVVVDQAPPRTRFSLELLAASDPAVFQVHGRLVTIGGQVTYRVVGWDELQHALVAEIDG